MSAVTVPIAVPDLLGTAPADLIDRWAEQPVATRDVATRRAERIRAGVASYAAMRQDIADAYACRDWLALDYPTWHAYVEGEFGAELRALSRDERREAVRDLRTQGMSTRQIASATGVDQSTIVRDTQVMRDASPATVTGSDGKTYAATRPETPARRDPEPTSGGPAIATTGGPVTTPESAADVAAALERHEQEAQRESERRAAITNLRSVLTYLVSASIAPAELADRDYAVALDEFSQDDLDYAAETMAAIAAMKRGA